MPGFMKKTAAIMAAVLTLMLFAPMAGAADVRRSSQALEVNGQEVRCEAYNIDGSNYFKLRDVAMLLTDTGSRFSVSYDGEKQAVMIATGSPYSPIGGELEAGEDMSATAQPTRQRIFIDGAERADLGAWNIGGEKGSNYFKLRDLGEALGFHVDYDEDTKTILVRSRFQPGQARLTETEDAGREYLDKIIFLGECTTYGIGAYYEKYGFTDLCPPSQIWTPRNGTLTLAYHSEARIVYPPTGEELTIAECAGRAKPEILLITLGVNGVSFMDEDWFKREYRTIIRLVREASPRTEIILNSIYPVADSYQYQGSINNKKISAANEWIEALAEEMGCPFLYSFECLAEDGKLPESRQNGDGLHLTGAAFGLVMEYIRTHALVGMR